jgi:uncharacterized RDD family membrane protein YckC
MAFGDIVLLKDRTPHGPYTRARIQEGLSRGEFTARDLAHTPGLKDWLPLLEVLHHLDRETVQMPRPRETRILPPLPYAPPDSGATTAPAVDTSSPAYQAKFAPPSFTTTSVFTVPVEEIPPPPAPGLPPTLPLLEANASAPEISAPPSLSKPPVLPPIAPPLPQRNPAPMRQRIMAWAIDWAVLFVPVLAVFALAYAGWLIRGPIEHRDPETARQEQALLWRNVRDLLFMVAIGFAWIYAAGLESSRWQGTVGKQVMGLVVTDAEGRRLDFLRATGRHAAKYLSALPLFLGFIAAFSNAQRLTWHDRLAGTRVVER